MVSEVDSWLISARVRPLKLAWDEPEGPRSPPSTPSKGCAKSPPGTPPNVSARLEDLLPRGQTTGAEDSFQYTIDAINEKCALTQFTPTQEPPTAWSDSSSQEILINSVDDESLLRGDSRLVPPPWPITRAPLGALTAIPSPRAPAGIKRDDHNQPSPGSAQPPKSKPQGEAQRPSAAAVWAYTTVEARLNEHAIAIEEATATSPTSKCRVSRTVGPPSVASHTSVMSPGASDISRVARKLLLLENVTSPTAEVMPQISPHFAKALPPRPSVHVPQPARTVGSIDHVELSYSKRVPQPTWTVGSIGHVERSYSKSGGVSLCLWDHLPERDPHNLSYMGRDGQHTVGVAVGGQRRGAEGPAHSTMDKLLTPRPRSDYFSDLYTSGTSHASHVANLSRRMHESTTSAWRSHSWRGQDHASSSPHSCEVLRPVHGFGTSFLAPVASRPYPMTSRP